MGDVSMKVQRGIVKYKDRNDIVCTYGVTNDGTQYYFIDSDGKKLSNDSHIVSTALVEAVDSMVKATHIGVIDKNGKVLVPCENKTIKPINEDVLIVERAFPVSQNVLDALEKRNDTATAPSLVSAAATIKDKMNSRMGSEGRFLINDQFSEATVCDIDGNNLVNNEYYSYIGSANDELFLCKNNPEFDIIEFSITDKKIKDTKSEEVIDVQNTEVNPSTVENALIDESANEKVKEIEKKEEKEVGGFAPLDLNDFFGNQNNDSLDTVSMGVNTISPEEVKEVTGEIKTEDIQKELGNTQDMNPMDMPPVVDAEDVADVVAGKVEIEDTSKITPPIVDEEVAVETKEKTVHNELPEENVEEVKEETLPVEEVVNEKNEEVVEEAVQEEVKEETKEAEEPIAKDNAKEDIEEFSSQIESDIKETPINKLSEEVSNDNPIEEVKFNANVTSIDPGVVSETVDKDKNGVLDSKESMDYSYNYDDYDTYNSNFSNDSIMSDVVRSMSDLMRQNREQKSVIADYKRRFSEIESQNRMMAGKLRGVDGVMSKLDKKVKEQARLIESKDRELKKLRSEISSKQDLVKMLADAKELLGEDDYSYSDDTSYYRRAS